MIGVPYVLLASTMRVGGVREMAQFGWPETILASPFVAQPS